ncbi:MAG TPA: hypothetical protein VIK55_12710 [Paludibacter sp.]
MKKIYFIASLAVLALFTGCQDYNPDISAITKNVVQYNYTLTDADYATIATVIKKPVNDSITTYKTQLKTAKTTADSTFINNRITALNLKLTTDSVYIKASYVASNKFFNSKLQAKDYIPYLLNTNYPYTDNGSSFRATYNNVDNGDTLSIPAASRFTLVDADYISMGSGTNQPGQYKEISSVMSAMYYLNQYLKIKCAYAVTNDVKVVSYLYYDSNKSAKKQYRILTFDGQNWVGTNGQYINNGTTWLYDPTIVVPLVKVSGNNPYIMKFIDYIRTTTPDKFYQKGTYTNEEHYYGFSAYYAEIICTGDRTTFGDAVIKAATTTEAKNALFKQRVIEAMPLFTQLNFPLLTSQVSGLQQYVVFTIISYYSSSKIGLVTIKMKCTVSGTSTTPAVYELVSYVETGI